MSEIRPKVIPLTSVRDISDPSLEALSAETALQEREQKAKELLALVYDIQESFYNPLARLLERAAGSADAAKIAEVVRMIACHYANNQQLKENFDTRIRAFLTDHITSRYIKHDLSNSLNFFLTPFDNFIDANYFRDDRSSTSTSDDDIASVYLAEAGRHRLAWSRVRVALEDIMLRSLGEVIVPSEYVGHVDLQIIEDIIIYFTTTELPKMRVDPVIGSKQFFSFSFFADLQQKIGEREIVGNTGLVGNFLLNALRNALKAQVEAQKVWFTARVDDNQLIFRIEDDGKGMEKKHLTEGHVDTEKESGSSLASLKPTFIFSPGVSDTGSSGLGLANFHTRIESIGGEVYVVSRRRGQAKDAETVCYQRGGTKEQLSQISLRDNKHGTIFEVRLPLK